MSSLHLKHDFARAIQDLNSLQSKSNELALAKYKDPRSILPSISRQLKLVNIQHSDIDNLKLIHVSGTKGKGSVCAFTESILRAHGLKTGFYNSPHLTKVTERIKIDGKPISDEKFVKYFREVFDKLKNETQQEKVEMSNYFSFLTILAFYTFIREKVDCAVLEVGIGGEYDPTYVVERPIVCGITTLDYDHTNILGDTLESIAWNKAGIIKHKVPVFTVKHEHQSALEVIKERAHAKEAPLYICRSLDPTLLNFELGIKSSVQYVNASLACQLARHVLKTIGVAKSCDFNIEKHDHLEILPHSLTLAFIEGLRTCSWPGRCQILKKSNIIFFLDGAHTEKSMQNCMNWFSQMSINNDQDAERILMINIIGERDKTAVLRPLAKYRFDHVVFSTNRIISEPNCSSSGNFLAIDVDRSFENARKNASAWTSLLDKRVRNTTDKILKSNITDCLDFITKRSSSNPEKSYHILVTGSLHFVGAVLGALTVPSISPQINVLSK